MTLPLLGTIQIQSKTLPWKSASFEPETLRISHILDISISHSIVLYILLKLEVFLEDIQLIEA